MGLLHGIISAQFLFRMGMAIDYISQEDNGGYIELDCPHYVYNDQYKKIADEIRKFINR